LPADLLRRNGVAKSSAEVELEFARCVHQRLLRAAPTITFSYAQSDGTRLLRPSPLLADIKQVSPAPLPPSRLAWQMLASALGAATCPANGTPSTSASNAPRTTRPDMPAAMAMLADAQAPAVAEGEKVSGGTWLLRAQAICPAWGYFQFRLGADVMEQPVEGLDPRARGTLVHGALEAFWRRAVDSATLHAYSAAVLHAAIGEAVAQTIAEFEQARHQTLPARFRQLEAGRLERLLATWLTLEKQRPVPFEVIACEQEAVVEIEKIRVKMFVDRIDQLADGRRVIIDYKTGATIDTKNWASERITEPQLPIYAAIASDAPVAAVVFAKVLADKPAFSGVAEQGDVLPGVRALDDPKEKRFAATQFPAWPALIAHWHDRLHAIAREVREGVAGVMVTDENALAYCPVLPLLRLAEREQLLAQSLMPAEAPIEAPDQVALAAAAQGPPAVPGPTSALTPNPAPGGDSP
jgi:exodeoxyribonuclease-5